MMDPTRILVWLMVNPQTQALNQHSPCRLLPVLLAAIAPHEG